MSYLFTSKCILSLSNVEHSSVRHIFKVVSPKHGETNQQCAPKLFNPLFNIRQLYAGHSFTKIKILHNFAFTTLQNPRWRPISSPILYKTSIYITCIMVNFTANFMLLSIKRCANISKIIKL
jgi:hypothetical protein